MSVMLVMDTVITTVITLLVHTSAPAIVDISYNPISTAVKVINYV